MTIEEILKYIESWSVRFENRLTELVDSLDTRLQGAQRELVKRFLEALNDMFETEGKNLKKSTRNIQALGKFNRLFNKWEREMIGGELALFTTELLEVGGLTIGYYEATDTHAKAAEIQKSLDLLRAVIGIDKDGVLIEGGYLSNLGNTQVVRDELRQYVVQSIVTKKSLSDFQKGFKSLVEGNPDTDGALQRYWRQYSYDAYNMAHEIVNSSMADELKLKYFIYQGSVIPTTRQFCRKKAGKVFSTAEAAKWKNDPDLIDKKTAASYNPLLERGRWNCRHFLNYISDELAVQLRPDLK